MCDSKGVIYVGRDENMEPTKARYAQKTECRIRGLDGLTTSSRRCHAGSEGKQT